MPELNILNELSERYGADTPMDYVSDRWGTESFVITPAEAIAMHEELGWGDTDYAVRISDRPGSPTLVEVSTGNDILVVREATA